ncbi:MAG: hypothetical protein M5U34_18850 [Chloroflexi bacterium]|nr:hypothetical protein [Chloroflexota bacterium]
MNDAQTIIETLRERRFRITPQREMIIDALLSDGPHPHCRQGV